MFKDKRFLIWGLIVWGVCMWIVYELMPTDSRDLVKIFVIAAAIPVGFVFLLVTVALFIALAAHVAEFFLGEDGRF